MMGRYLLSIDILVLFEINLVLAARDHLVMYRTKMMMNQTSIILRVNLMIAVSNWDI